MTDQMPDEVWACPSAGVVCTGTWWSFQHEEDRNAVRYIRADLYDSKACPHVVGEVTQHCALAQDAVRRLTQRAEQAEAELAARRADDESAASMLLLDLPEPGTPMAQMFRVRAQLIRRAEQAEADRDTLGHYLERTLARARELESKVADLSALAQWAVDLEAERDRLRAVLADIAADPYDYQRVQDKAQEALDHD